MSPSRGLNVLIRARPTIFGSQTVRRYSDFVRGATNPENKSQIYISRTDDPYINLSIEHYLLQKTPADSTVLFLYTNKPCVVIGRNQNPWVEVNLGMLRNTGLKASLVRRRSGGGTVWHDPGNINYSVICPTPVFNRDKHAQMVARALKTLGLDKVRVNERHDIVYDKTIDVAKYSKEELSGEAQEGDLIEKTFKISGSAYKLTRLRSLHHGTCIAWSENINAFSRYLRSPAKPLIIARGVESVNSPVTNLEREPQQIEQAVVSEFSKMYDAGQPVIVTDAEAAIPEIASGVKELMSEDWIYCQTPQFTFSTEGADSGWGVPSEFKASFTARHGQISDISLEYGNVTTPIENDLLASSLRNQKLHEIRDWTEAFNDSSLVGNIKENTSEKVNSLQEAGFAMNYLFGIGNHLLKDYIRPWGLGIKDFLELTKNGILNQGEAELINHFHETYSADVPNFFQSDLRHIEREKMRSRWRERSSKS